MSDRDIPSHDTDTAWKAWGERDPYFGVITDQRYRKDRLTAESLDLFFRSGDSHVKHVASSIRRYIDPGYQPKRVLDFGCGVGRLLPAFARLGAEVWGIDISEAMLQEARRNCERMQVPGVHLALSDDELSHVEGSFDLVHTAIVLQHIEARRGVRLVDRLISKLAPGGVAALHMTYAKRQFSDSYGSPPAAQQSTVPSLPVELPLWRRLINKPSPPTAVKAPSTSTRADEDPEMQMNPYPLNDVMFLIQQCGAKRVHVEFSDHGGELGGTFYFSRPA